MCVYIYIYIYVPSLDDCKAVSRRDREGKRNETKT